MNILIASDFVLIRDGLKRIVSQHFGQAATIGESGTAMALSVELGEMPWEVLLLDVQFLGEKGVELLRQVRTQYPQLAILLMSIDCHHPLAVQAIKAGAKGYLTRNDLMENLPHAITKVLKGGRYINSEIAEKLAEAVHKDRGGQDLSQILSERELAIMSMLSQGTPPKRIAYDLNLSIKTVSTYRGRALKKMNMQSNAEFFRYVLKNNLMP